MITNGCSAHPLVIRRDTRMSERQTIIAAALLTVLAAVIFAMTIVRAVFYAPEDELPNAPLASSSTPPAYVDTLPRAPSLDEYPARLIIPSLQIDAQVQYVGINTQGNMGIPNNFTDVGWYKYGTVPGHLGSAVMAGHVDNGLGMAGVFKHLDGVLAGDDIYVVAKNGTKIHFVVTDAKSYSYLGAPTEMIFQKSDGIYLNLVTCSGRWMNKEKTYDRRIVVSARLAI